MNKPFPYKNKRVFLLWSGGLDSTFLIYHLLRGGARVEAGYVKVLNNEEKAKREEKAIKKLVKEFRSNDDWKDTGIFNYLGVLQEVLIKRSQNAVDLLQVPLWMNSMVLTMGSGFVIDCVALGYVMGDCAISYLDDIKKVYKAYEGFSGKKFPPIVFPLKKFNKNGIFQALPERFLKHVTCCERDPEWCGECKPCRTWMECEYSRDFPEYARHFVDKRKIPEITTIIADVDAEKSVNLLKKANGE